MLVEEIFWIDEKNEGQNLSDHFKASEFKCADGTSPYPISRNLVLGLEALRLRAGAGIKITSGYRSPAHNARVGGVADSQHIFGRAADIQCKSILDMFKLANLAYAVGFRRIGVSPTFIHVDVGSGESYWVYEKSGVRPATAAELAKIKK